jgi:hypothetical protein
MNPSLVDVHSTYARVEVEHPTQTHNEDNQEKPELCKVMNT